MSPEKQREKTRTLIVHKDESGYGLTLSGDKPTRVQTVRAGGASHRAGVREGDVIIKVNGQQVTDSLHGEVVKLIQAGSYVALTVVHTSRILQDGTCNSSNVSSSERRDSCRQPTPSITGPQPADEELMRQVQSHKMNTIQLMMEQQAREIEEIKVQLARSNSKKLRNQLLRAEKNLADLEYQAQQLRQASPDKSTPELRMRVGPLPPTPGQSSSSTTSPSSYWSQSPTGDTAAFSPPPVAPPRVESLTFSGLITGSGDAAPPLPARNTEPAPAPPPRNPAGLPPPAGQPPTKLPRPVSHESINNVSVGGHQRRGSHATPPHTSFRTGGSGAEPSSSPDHVAAGRATHISHTRTRSSPVSLEQTLEVAKSMNLTSGEHAGRKSPRYETPPGTPPPPYPAAAYELNDSANLVTWAGLLAGSGGGNVGSVDIITMEDEDCEEEGAEGGTALQHLPPEGDHGPFNSLRELLQHSAHLAVFLNYVISNADPAPLLFYLITDAYKQGSAKDMRKWAYEIHSCFLMPNSPLELPNLEPQVINHIDNFLSEELNEREESLLNKLFWKVRSRARDILKVQLDEFRAKRALGMGNIYGPQDHELKQCEENSHKRTQVIEERLLPILETMLEDGESASDRNATLCSSLATVLSKTFNQKSAQAVALLEKTPTFISKEKNKEKFIARVFKKTIQVKGHQFNLQYYEQVTYCNHTQQIIWGIGPQGYRCQNCDFDVHKKHVHSVEEPCVGPSVDKKQKKRGSRFIIGFPRSSKEQQLLEPMRKAGGASVSPSPSVRGTGDLAGGGSPSFRSYASGLLTAEDQVDKSVSTPLSQHGRLESRPLPTPPSGGPSLQNPQHHTALLDSAARKLGGAISGSDLNIGSRSSNSGSETVGGAAASPMGGTKAVASIKRSESAKDGNKRIQPKPQHRKHSDPNLAHNRLSLDADCRVSKSGSSSCSSIAETSRLFDFHQPPPPPPPRQQLSPPPLPMSSPVDEVSTEAAAVDSDLESTDVDPPDWRTSIPREVLASMKPREQKRQDVINELFYTERSHVRNLKILDSVFRRPLMESGLMPVDMVDRLFPNIEEVVSVHQAYSTAMRERAKKGFPIGSIGDILSNMFLGSFGDTLIRVGAEFTQNQKFTIEELKKARAREPRLEQFLADIERNPICRRLQLQGILPVEHQRLVKYPLLLEGLAKHCDPGQDPAEYEIMREVTNRTRQILESIDKQVAEAQNKQKLMDIQRNLDTTGLEKLGPDDNICKEYRNLDLTKHRLIYDGLLTLNLGGENKRVKHIELHVLLLEECVMFLQKQDEKFLLKFHTGATSVIAGAGGREDTKKFLPPVIKFSSLLERPVATNKRAFYVMNTTNNGAQLYELVASSQAERSTWLKQIGEAIAAYKSRDTRRDFRASASMSNMSMFANGRQPFELPSVGGSGGGVGGTMPIPTIGEEGGRKAMPAHAGRSQSFNEVMRRDAIINRPLPSPPIERYGQEDESLESKLKRLAQKDEEVARALEEKQKIISDIFNIPPEEYDSIADIVTLHEDKKDADDLVLSIMNQVDSLSRYANECLKVAEDEEPPRLLTPASDKLLQITAGLSTSLNKLLGLIREQDEEKSGWRPDLLPSRDDHGGEGRVGGSGTASNNPEYPCSRPDSFLSLESSDLGSEDGNRSDFFGGGSTESGQILIGQIAELVCDEEAAVDAGLQSSTPVKDTTPTNEEPPPLGGVGGGCDSGNNSGNNSLLLVEGERSLEVAADFIASDC